MANNSKNLSSQLNEVLKKSGMRGTVVMVYKNPDDGDEPTLRYAFAQNLMNDRQALAYICEAVGGMLHTATPGLIVTTESAD